MGNNTTANLALFENVNVIVAQSSKIGCATDGSRTSTNDCDGLFIGRWQVLRERWISNLSDTHFFENSNGKFLKSVDLNCSLLRMAHIAVTSAQLTDGAELTASQTKGII